ncbi:hypothetical protein NL676_035666 [Syzygium grande]|nr:hypothetical protein NL676_035666 [Syzygium grande]
MDNRGSLAMDHGFPRGVAACRGGGDGGSELGAADVEANGGVGRRRETRVYEEIRGLEVFLEQSTTWSFQFGFLSGGARHAF